MTMASAEFYHNTADMFEEFKKREIQLLNLQLSSSSTTRWENRLSAQEYIEQIDKRQKEAEETYNSIKKRMNSLDEKSNSILVELEKLSILQSCIMPSKPSNSIMDSNPALHNFPNPMLNAFTRSSSEIGTHSISTQTNYTLCEHCHSPLSSNKNSNSNKSNIISQIPTCVTTNSDFSPSFYKSTQHFQSKNEEEISSLFLNNDSNLNSKIISPVVKSVANTDTTQDKEIKIATDTHSFTESVEEALSSPIIENELKVEKNEVLANQNRHINTLSKSDDESMNHEFDFLESDKTRVEKKTNVHATSAVESMHNINETHTAFYQSDIGGDEKNQVLEPAMNENITNYKSCENLTISKETLNVRNEVKLNSSESNEPTSPSVRSIHDSLPSDSDSVFETETPISANAAYQALLGISSAKKAYKPPEPVDTDSDDVENALKSAVRRSSKLLSDIEPKSDKPIENKKPLAPPENKSFEAKRKSSIINTKPHSKLSKDTQIVLGLDISSGSEEEYELKSTSKHVDDDSDEFYN